jgi:hypothetical protein
MSIGDAKNWCTQHPEALGFCFNGPPGDPPDAAVVTIHFKSKADWAPGEGWHTYIKSVHFNPPAPAPAPAPAPVAAPVAAPASTFNFAAPPGGAPAQSGFAGMGSGHSIDKGLIDLTAAYQNNGYVTHKAQTGADNVEMNGNVKAVQAVKLAGEDLKINLGVKADHRKFANGEDVSDDLAHAAPKRDKDLHPSATYAGDGDEVDDDEWD